MRKDKLTATRETYQCVSGEVHYLEPIIVAQNIPCHLSSGLENVVYLDKTPYIISNYTLFLDYDQNIQIKENDTLYVQTQRGENYKLRAGEIKKYNLTIQIKCTQKKILES